MKPTATLHFGLLALLAAPAAAAPSVRDFELPPGPTQTPSSSVPQVQGPVDPEAPAATRPRPVPTATAQPTPAPSPTATPAAQPPEVAVPRPAANSRQPTPAASEEPDTTATPSADNTATDTTAPVETSTSPGATPVLPTPQAAGDPDGSDEGSSLGSILAAVAGVIAVLAGLAAGLVWWRRRQTAAETAPQIELLLVTPEDNRAPVSPPASLSPPATLPVAASASMLRIEATPSHLTRSMMAATFSCRVALVNRGEQPIEDVTVGLDLTTAHGSVPEHEQRADPSRPLPVAGRFARIAPGETVEFAQDVRLPTAEIRTLRQGEARLYVPLLRVRAQAGGAAPIARTFIVGTLPDASAKKLQPFRLDEMPQTYRSIGVAALD